MESACTEPVDGSRSPDPDVGIPPTDARPARTQLRPEPSHPFVCGRLTPVDDAQISDDLSRVLFTEDQITARIGEIVSGSDMLRLYREDEESHAKPPSREVKGKSPFSSLRLCVFA